MSPSVRDDFKKEAKELNDYVALIVVNAGNYRKSRSELLNYFLADERIPGVYITLNKPYDIILRELGSNADTRLVIFIDCITQIAQGRQARQQNCVFIGTPEKLSDLFVALDQAVNSITVNEKFIFLDTLNTLTLFNAEATIARFIHQLVAKIRAWKAKGIILTIHKNGDEDLLSDIAPFCDIRLDE